MEKVNVEEKYQDRIFAIWKKYKDLPFLNEEGKEYRISPLFPKSVKKNTLMFVGLNPAFRKKRKNRDALKSSYDEPVEFQGKDIQYYEKIKEVAKYCNKGHWTHLDMLFVRETDSKAIDKLSCDPRGKQFICEQLEISHEIIKEAQPKIIVVVNALAAEFFGKKKSRHKLKKHEYDYVCEHAKFFKDFERIWLGYNLEFDSASFNEELGTYVIEINSKKVPIILSGMLSGQRALDIGSYERLKWQIKRILTLL